MNRLFYVAPDTDPLGYVVNWLLDEPATRVVAVADLATGTRIIERALKLAPDSGVSVGRSTVTPHRAYELINTVAEVVVYDAPAWFAATFGPRPVVTTTWPADKHDTIEGYRHESTLTIPQAMVQFPEAFDLAKVSKVPDERRFTIEAVFRGGAKVTIDDLTPDAALEWLNGDMALIEDQTYTLDNLEVGASAVELDEVVYVRVVDVELA